MTTSEEFNAVSASPDIAVGAAGDVAVAGAGDVAVAGADDVAVAGAVDMAVAVAGEFVGGGGGEKEDTQMEIVEGMEEQNVGNYEEGEEEEGEEEEEEEVKEEDEYDNQVAPLSADSEMYPVQAIRRKRVVKGQVQYLVKWLGWSESANTWEPPEHLENIADMIDAFEQSSASAKQQRKRRRTSVSNHSQRKRRQERSNTPYSLRRICNAPADNHTLSAPADNRTQSAPADNRTLSAPADNRTLSAPPNDANITDPCAFPRAVLFADELENNGDPNSLGKAKVSNGSGSTNPPELSKSNEENEYDPKLIELKAASASGHGAADRLATQVQEGNVATNNAQVDGRLKGVNVEQDQIDNSRGVVRKESGSANKSQEDSHAGDPIRSERPIGTLASTAVQVRTGVSDFVWHKSQKKKKKVLATPVYDIIKIIRSVGCSPTVSGGLCVTFMALRWDGMEVMVDNRYLKSHHPEMLIDFYEKRINYNSL